PVYYEIVNIPELTDYSRQSRVYPVSPTTLYAHLQMILLSFEGKKIEAKSRQVFQLLRAVQNDYEKTEGVMAVLGKHLGNAYNQMGNVSQSFGSLGQKLSSMRILSAEKTEEDEAKRKEIDG
ncbi:DNA recombination protein RmuC, partial [Patescibacteria group bacterium]|nr:DNA recombination protein RmuC [Patescibacteria group bacterium]